MTLPAHIQSVSMKASNTMISLDDQGPPVPSTVICGQDLIVLGAAVAHFGRGLSEEVLSALSWALLNRRGLRDEAEPAPAGRMAERWAAALLADPLEQDTTRALAVFTRVLAGGIADPTDGSSRFHSHDETPTWAEHMEIRAIVGPYLFYAPVPKNLDKS